MKNRRAGVTLIELMVGIILIAIASVGGLRFFVYCNNYVIRTDSRVAAVNFAMETMEKFYMVTSAGLGSDTDTANPPADALPSSSGGFLNKLKDSHSGTRSYAISTSTIAIGTPALKYRIVSVAVNWD